MDTEKATFEIARMARLLEVSRSGYYAWTRRQTAGPSAAQQRRAELTVKIRHLHAESDDVYGSPRILADLREAGETVSAKTVARLMAANGIAGISPRKFTPVTTVPGLGSPQIPDLVCRDFDRGTLNAVWMSDITYLGTDQGWLYLCAVRDGCSRRVLGWAIDDHLRTHLVEKALRMAHTMAATCPTESSSTPTAAASTPRPSSLKPPPSSACCSQSAGPGCVGTTPGLSRSGPP